MKVYEMDFDEDEHDYIAAQSPEDAQDYFTERHGEPAKAVRQLTDEQIDTMTVAVSDEDESLTGETVTLREMVGHPNPNNSLAEAWLVCSSEA